MLKIRIIVEVFDAKTGQDNYSYGAGAFVEAVTVPQTDYGSMLESLVSVAIIQLAEVNKKRNQEAEE